MTTPEAPISDTRLTPATRQPNPMTDATTEMTSMRGRVVSMGVTKNTAVHAMAATDTTANSAKMARQENMPMSRPARVGPITGANMMTSPATPLAAPIWAGGKTRMIAAYIEGSTMPVPTPCRMRPASTRANTGEAAETTAPTRKQQSATITRVLAFTHLSSNPTQGSTMPMASI